MRVLEKLDAWAVARIYQPVVDFTGWRIGVFGSVLSAILAGFCMQYLPDATGVSVFIHGFSLLSYLVFSLIFWLSDAMYARFFHPVIRVLVYMDLALAVLLVAVSICLGASMPLAKALGSLTMCSLYYFSRCAPPRPRVPRRKPALSGIG